MTEPDAFIDVAPQPPRRRSRWVLPVIASMAVLLIAAGALVTWMALGNRAAAPAMPVTINGTAVLVHSISVLNLDDVHCEGMNAYADIKPGTQVTVTDPAGAVVAVGILDGGRMIGVGMTRTCRFTFRITNVPSGKGFYGVEVAHRGRVQFPESELGSVILSIGS
jgi:hypothetical protein